MIPLTLALVDYVMELRAGHWTIANISEATGLPRDVCENIVAGRTWPKIVTRVEDDGSAEMVRYP